MRSIRALLSAAIVLSLFSLTGLIAHAQPAPSETPTIRVTSRLVFLDVTVLDKNGNPVVTGLTKDDFTITEDKKPQRIFSFEAPETHVVDANSTDDNPAGKAPVTIFVLDLLNSNFDDFAYIRSMVRKYLLPQPEQLNSPAELMVLGNESLEMVQGYTRSKADLLYALDHVPPALPYKKMNKGNANGFVYERFLQSIDTLQQIALQNKGVPGRKNVIWIGHGGPNISTTNVTSSIEDLNRYLHNTTNQLVDSRISLFVIYPGLNANAPAVNISQVKADADFGNEDPFSGDINFGVFVNETGGSLFYNRNDVNNEIRQSMALGSEYYTLTYQPPQGEADGRLRRIRVSLRNPDLRVVTKAGYFAPEKNDNVGPRQQIMVNMTEAARSTLPFKSLEVTIEDLVRHPDTGTAEFTVRLAAQKLDWQSTEDGKSRVQLSLAAASLGGRRELLASKLEGVTATASNQDSTRLAKTVTRVPMTIRIPRKTKSLRVVLQTAANGRIGTAELDRKTIDNAPEEPTPEPKLLSRAPAPELKLLPRPQTQPHTQPQTQPEPAPIDPPRP
jgi:VWFA-related protein